MMLPNTHTYHSFEDRQYFPYQYFSGCDTRLYIGEHEAVEEITGIQYMVTENVLPVYGYASFTYDAVARGNRLINGSFRINYVSPNYLIEKIRAVNPPRTPEDPLPSPEVFFGLTLDEFDEYQRRYTERYWGEYAKVNPKHRPIFSDLDDGFTIRIKFGMSIHDHVNDQGVSLAYYTNSDEDAILYGVQLVSFGKTIQISGQQFKRSTV